MDGDSALQKILVLKDVQELSLRPDEKAMLLEKSRHVIFCTFCEAPLRQCSAYHTGNTRKHAVQHGWKPEGDTIAPKAEEAEAHGSPPPKKPRLTRPRDVVVEDFEKAVAMGMAYASMTDSQVDGFLCCLHKHVPEVARAASLREKWVPAVYTEGVEAMKKALGQCRTEDLVLAHDGSSLATWGSCAESVLLLHRDRKYMLPMLEKTNGEAWDHISLKNAIVASLNSFGITTWPAVTISDCGCYLHFCLARVSYPRFTTQPTSK